MRHSLGEDIDQWPLHAEAKGISRRCVLRDVPSLFWPESFPFDTMHLIALNMTKELFLLLWGQKWNDVCKKRTGGRRENADLDPEPEQSPFIDGSHYYVSKADKKRISDAFRTARSSVPMYISPPPRALDEYYTNFKTAEWKAFLLVYGPALLMDTIPKPYWKNFNDLSQLYQILLNQAVQSTDIDAIQAMATRFVQGYEKLYYRDFKDMTNKYNNLPRYRVCTLQPHSLLHLADNVADWGPAKNYAQWLPEGHLKTIKDEADCPSHMVTSLINGVTDDDRYNLAMMKLDRYRSTPQKRYPRDGQFLQQKNINPDDTSEHIKHLRTLIREWEELRPHDPIDLQLYGALRLPNGALVTPVNMQRRSDVTRNNAWVAFKYRGHGDLLFGEVLHLVRGNGYWSVAYIQHWDTRKIGGIATLRSKKAAFWVRSRHVEGLVGIVTVEIINKRNRLVKKKRVVGKDGIYDEMSRCIPR